MNAKVAMIVYFANFHLKLPLVQLASSLIVSLYSPSVFLSSRPSSRVLSYFRADILACSGNNKAFLPAIIPHLQSKQIKQIGFIQNDSTDNDDLQPLGEDTAAQSESSDNTDSMANSATAEEPVPNPGVENLMEMDQAARDKFIQNMRDLSWDEFDKIRKTLPKRSILRPANWARGDENHACPEKLPEARDSPGVDQTSGVYQTLAEPRNDKNADSPEPCPAPENPSDPSRSIATRLTAMA
ncbi:hypothetical protein N7467_002732 [Penicillium canescens]|nr:hypothetical protein N7467_002732 [Penicillium canescens]